jgi:long-chain acyl-CoA synthetase
MPPKKLAIANRETLFEVYPPGVRWDIEIPEICIPQMLDEAVARYGDRLHSRFQPNLHLPGKNLTFNEIQNLVSRAAKGLQEMGVQKGTKVGLFMPNTPYYQIMEYAAWRVGAVVVNYDTTFTKEQLRSQIKDSDTSVMVTLDLANDLANFHDKVLELRLDGTLESMVRCDMEDMLPPLTSQLFQLLERKKITSLDKHSGDLSPHPGRKKGDYSVNFSELTNNDGHFAPVLIKPGDIAAIQYTSGTSGKPKGALLTHRNYISNIYQLREYFSEGPEKSEDVPRLKIGKERIIAVLPYWHTYGNMVGALFATHIGATMSIIADPRKIVDTMATIDKHQITTAPLVPKQQMAISEHPDVKSYDFSKLEFVITGGAALAPNVLAAFREVTGVQPTQGYGMSESTPVASSTPLYGIIKPTAVGHPVPRTEIRVANQDNLDETVGLNEPGMICVRGPQVFAGYHNNPEETAKTLRGEWLVTGDRGMMDDDYVLHHLGRDKRMFKPNTGEQIVPEDIEDAISRHPSVAECVVIRVPDKAHGHIAKAIIRLKNDAAIRPNEAQMNEFIRPLLQKHNRPRRIEFWTQDLPKTSMGKPDWNRLQNEELEKYNAQNKTDHTPKPN